MPGIFDLLPQPQMEPAVPLDESERINELTSQLGLLNPDQKMQGYDPLGWQQRSKSIEIGDGMATTKRTKGDIGKAILSTLFEGIRAAGGGRGYENPWDRQRKQYVEDYKREAPRLLDELRILNQNKRQYQADQSREKTQASKNEMLGRVAKLKADTDMAKANLRRMSEQERNALQKEHDALVKEGYKLPFEHQLVLGQVGATLKELRENPNIATAAAQQAQQNNAINFSIREAAKGAFGPTKEKIMLGSSRQAPDPNSDGILNLNSQRESLVSKPNAAAQNLLNQFITGKNPVNTNLFPQQPQQPQAQPLPQSQTPIVPGLPPQQARPINQQPKLSPESLKPESAPGATAINRASSDIFADAGSTFYTKPPSGISQWLPQDFGLEKNPQTAKFLNASLYDNVVGYVPTQDGRFRSVDNPSLVVEPKFYGPPATRRKQQQDFQTFRDATYALNSFAALAARQYIAKKQNLFTGRSGTTGMPADQALDWNQSLRSGPLKQGADAVTRMGFGRTPDSVDQYLALLTTESYLKKIYESTGKQLNDREMTAIAKTWVSTMNNPDAFMERLLQLTIKANRKLHEQYKNFEKKNKQFNLGDLYSDTDTYAVVNAKRALQELKKGRYNYGMLRPDLE